MFEKVMPGLVMVEYEPREEKETASGILIATPKHQGMPNHGRVIQVADDIEEIKAGDFIYYSANSPTGFEYEGKKIIPIKIDDVLCKVVE